MPSRRKFKKIVKQNTRNAVEEILALNSFDSQENVNHYQQLVEQVVEKEIATVQNLSNSAVSKAASPKEHFRSLRNEYDTWIIGLSQELDDREEALISAIRKEQTPNA